MTVEERLGSVEQRLVGIETQIEHTATREDLEKAKTSILRWLVATIIVAASSVAAVVSSI